MNRKVQSALDDLREGRPIVLVDEYDRENEGDVVVAGEKGKCRKYYIYNEQSKGANVHPL